MKVQGLLLVGLMVESVLGLAEIKPADRIPVVDISGEASRQVVIAEGAVDRYEGHPTTLLADDGKTMFCVWTTGHGGPCGQMARSDDGGRTWTRMDSQLPAVYARTHRNCPTLQKLRGPDGKQRYFIYSAKVKEGRGLGIMMSEDLGQTWVELPCQPQLSAGMPPTGVMELKDGTIALFGQVFKDHAKSKDRPNDDQAVWMAISKDGGRTYGEMRQIMRAENRNLCEPCCLRSPDGKSLVVLARENRHKGRSMMSFSHDEGKTWTAPVDTPWALTGDRHEGLLLPDGRYLIAFRDQAVGSSTRGQYMGWVGTFDDLVKGRPGQYRIHLLRHYGLKGKFPGGLWDTGYSGVERLPDGTIVCTTYSRHFNDERQSSVVSTRFTIDELDRKRTIGGVKLGKPFGSGMVLQRGRTVPVWGTASTGAVVTVSFAGQTKSATADCTGAWRVTLDPLTVSKTGQVMEVSDGSVTTHLENVLVGEVWLASGQSNMEFPLTSTKPRWRDDLGPLVAQVTQRERVRYFNAGANAWEPFNPQSLSKGEKSALAVYYAMELEQALDVPVGIVVAVVGGTLVEEWYAGGRRHGQLIKALGPLAMRGVIWYQGEGNLANYKAEDSRFGEKLRRLHGDWSTQFENPDLRFDYVQIAPHVQDYRANVANLALFMEGMGTFAANDARASMTVISDLGCHADIHPRHKLVVAKRLALHALKRDYGFSDIVADSPKAISAKAATDGKVTITFDHVKSLCIYHDERTYDPNVEICDGAGVWHSATIQNLPSRSWQNLGLIGGNELVVSATGVTNPTGVRHLYREPYQGCLFNEVNLPAGPFCIMFGSGIRTSR